MNLVKLGLYRCQPDQDARVGLAILRIQSIQLLERSLRLRKWYHGHIKWTTRRLGYLERTFIEIEHTRALYVQYGSYLLWERERRGEPMLIKYEGDYYPCMTAGIAAQCRKMAMACYGKYLVKDEQPYAAWVNQWCAKWREICDREVAPWN